jgi:hypothetical protein
MGELLKWTSKWDEDYFRYYMAANVRCADGRVRSLYASDILQEEPKECGKRFEPRLVSTLTRVLVQVHPETIEVFSTDGDYICQVRWIGGKMDYTQGGLPLVLLEDMFRKANA